MALDASETQLHQITDTVPALIAYIDAEQRFQFYNLAYEERFGLRREQIHGKTMREMMGRELYEKERGKIEEALAGYAAQYDRTQESADGKQRDYVMQYFPRYGEGEDEGKVLGFYSLGTDVTELKRIDRMKSEFVSTVSHELRTPLTSIRGSLGLIVGGVAGDLPPMAKNLVGIATSNCERLIRLINDILDSEKTESGKMRFDLQIVELQPLLAQVLTANEGFAGQHNVAGPGRPGRCGEGQRRQRPADPGPHQPDLQCREVLTGGVLCAPSGCCAAVGGSGSRWPTAAPASPRSSANASSRSSRRPTPRTPGKGGTGLGLNISRAIVERMNGSRGLHLANRRGNCFLL